MADAEWTSDPDVRRKIESNLEPGDREMLAKMLHRERVDPGAVLQIPAAKQFVSLLAVGNRAAEIQRVEGWDETTAYKAACREIGVPWAQVWQWRSRSWSPSSK